LVRAAKAEILQKKVTISEFVRDCETRSFRIILISYRNTEHHNNFIELWWCSNLRIFLSNRSIGLFDYINDIIDARGATNMALRILALIGVLYVGYLNLFIVSW
jgi:hypothetical protein